MTPQIEQEKAIIVGLGEIHVSNDPEVTLACLGLGSCVAVCTHDPVSKVGGMAHVVLPFSKNGTAGGKTATKYADVAIPHLLNEMREYGAVRSRLVVKIAGGAQRLLNTGTVFNTGEKNIEAVKQVLSEEAIHISAANTGGDKGRTVRLSVGTGQLWVRTIGSPDEEL